MIQSRLTVFPQFVTLQAQACTYLCCGRKMTCDVGGVAHVCIHKSGFYERVTSRKPPFERKQQEALFAVVHKQCETRNGLIKTHLFVRMIQALCKIHARKCL